MLVFPLGVTWLAAVVLAVLDGRRQRVGYLAVGALAVAVIGLVVLLVDILRNGIARQVAGNWDYGVGIQLRADVLDVTFALLSVTVILVATTFEVLGRVRSRVFPALACFMATGLIGLSLTGDAFNFYVFFEIAMISAYVLAGYGERTRQLRAALIFIIVNLLGSVLFLIAIAGLYHLTGTLDLLEISRRIPIANEQPSILLATLIFVAFAVKLGIFPFHFWLAAVYTGTRPAVAAMLSGALANIGSYGLLRFGATMPRELEIGAPVLLTLGAASIIYGGFQALSGRSAGEVLAYSSIGQVGYILIALGIGGHVGLVAAVLFAIVNAINKTMLFLAVPLRGWLVGAVMAIAAFSVAGVPPSSGFFGKLGVFRAAVADDQPYIIALILIGSALSFVYMFQLYNSRFWDISTEDAQAGVVPSVIARRGLICALAAFVIVIGVWPEPLLYLSEQAAYAIESSDQSVPVAGE
jgi:multicomponent Na+:H+ antiporter subunit D